MHGLWYERTWLDLGREAIIHVILSLLYVPAYRIKCVTSMVIVTIIGFQHLASLFVHPDGFLPNSAVIPGAAILAFLAYWKESPLLFFVGSYSILSKFDYLRLWTSIEFRLSLGSLEDTMNEISKLIVGLVFFAIFQYLLSPRKIKSLLRIPSLGPSAAALPTPSSNKRPSKPQARWFSEFIVPYELLIYYTKGWMRLVANEKDEMLTE